MTEAEFGGGPAPAAPPPVPAIEPEPAPVAALPPSAQNVYRTLEARGPLTHKDLIAVTGMPGRTVRYAVSRLKEAGVIGARCNLMDCRQCFFFVSGACPGEGRSPFVRGPGSAL